MKLNKITSALVVAGLAWSSSVALAYDTPIYDVSGVMVPYDNAVTQSYLPATVTAAILAGGGVRNPATPVAGAPGTPLQDAALSGPATPTTIGLGTTAAITLDGQLVKGAVNLGTGQQTVTLYDTPVGTGTTGGANGPSGWATTIVGSGTGYAAATLGTGYVAVGAQYATGDKVVGTTYTQASGTTGATPIVVPTGVTVIAGGTKYIGDGVITIPATTALVAGDTFGGVLAAPVIVVANSKVGGATVTATVAAPVTVATGTLMIAGDSLVTTQNQIAANTAYLKGSVINGVKMAADGVTGATATNAKAGDFVLTAAALSTAQTAFAAKSSRPGSGILNTSHDFFKSSRNNAGSVGLCTFCHTPHKAAATLLLWNHTMSSNNFAWEVAATTAGTALPGFAGNGYAGPSAKCMACHDGTVAYGDVGWFNGAAANGANALNTQKMTDTKRLVGTSSGNLAGNHPVAIPYPYQGAPNVYNNSKTGARLATNDFVLDPTGNGIRLYTDLGGSQIVGKATPGKSGMECTSCHDPHNKAAVDTLFLRGKLVGNSKADGYICAQCHSK